MSHDQTEFVRVSNLEDVLKGLTYLKGRTSDMDENKFENIFAVLSNYRDGGIYLGSFDGESAWERHASLEFIDPDGGEQFQIDCGVSVHGASSRGHASIMTRHTRKEPRHDLRLRPKTLDARVPAGRPDPRALRRLRRTF